jgi:hypothetical protein
MEKWIFFFKIIAWVIGTLSTLIGVFIVYAGWGYEGSLEETIDKMKGYKKVFRPVPYLVVSLICWAFIIAFW